ncbi:MAG: 5-formyltetrahydrofolate cyclo-ligase [Clostridiales bacterium]|nr:5-formyltetrahydrofolate cyclo-ligase [Clostridiales bacterium]
MDKKSLRTEIRRRISLLDSSYIEESNSSIFEKLICLPEFISAPRVFTYCSVSREVDTRKLINHCFEIGKSVALPTNLFEGNMSFALINKSPEHLPAGVLSIPEPLPDAEIVFPREHDLIIVPALCYDLNCYRLGQGGGYYDRFLSKCNAYSVGLCRELLLLEEVPTDKFDLPTKCLITEKRIARP